MTPPTQITRINCVEAGLRVMLLMVARTPGQSVLNWTVPLAPTSVRGSRGSVVRAISALPGLFSLCGAC